MLDKYCLPNIHFQNYINHRYNIKEFELINKRFLHNTFCEYNGAFYAVCNQLHSIDEVLTDYNFSDIRTDDVVLDIGANIGGFTIPVAKKAKQVFAVEPLYADILRKNVKKNDLRNVTIFNSGVGTGISTIKYGQKSKALTLTPFTDIIKRCGQIDFLKCDCEGCEWNIVPEDLHGMRRIEIEIHQFKNMSKLTVFEDILTKAGFTYEVTFRRNNTFIVHANSI